MTCPLVGSTLNAYFNNIDKNDNKNDNRKRRDKKRKKEDINQSIISRVVSFDKVHEISMIRKEKKKRAKEEKKTVLLYAPHGISKSPSQNLPRTCSSSP